MLPATYDNLPVKYNNFPVRNKPDDYTKISEKNPALFTKFLENVQGK